MTKLTLNNKTGWDTRDLRRVILAVVNDYQKSEGKHPYPLRVTVTYTRGHGVSGHAYLRSGTMLLRVQRPSLGDLKVFSFAHLVAHEFAHCRGQKHETMGRLNSWKYATAETYPYLVGITVRPQQQKTVAKVDHQIVRYQRILDRVDTWTAKVKRAQRSLAKLMKQRSYYERVLGADGRLAVAQARKPRTKRKAARRG